MRLTRVASLMAFLIGGAAHALAAPGDAIGSAVAVVNLVTAQFEKNDQRKLETGDDVRQQDLIEVSSDGRGEFKLRDQTKLALGPGSRLLLDRFIYDPDISGGAIVLNLAKGAFRFITGVAAKPAYVISHPNRVHHCSRITGKPSFGYGGATGGRGTSASPARAPIFSGCVVASLKSHFRTN